MEGRKEGHRAHENRDPESQTRTCPRFSVFRFKEQKKKTALRESGVRETCGADSCMILGWMTPETEEWL